MDNVYFWTNDNDKLIERSKRIAQISSQGSLTTDFLFSGYKFPIRTVKNNSNIMKTDCIRFLRHRNLMLSTNHRTKLFLYHLLTF